MYCFYIRRLDGAPATIEVLGEIVDAVKVIDSHMEVYMDGGIRKGLDVYRALAIGKCVEIKQFIIIYFLVVRGDLLYRVYYSVGLT